MYCKRCNAKLSDLSTICGLYGSTELTATPSAEPVPQAVPVAQVPAVQYPFVQEPVAQDPVAPSWQPSAPQTAPAAYEARTVYAPVSFPSWPKKSSGNFWNWAGVLLGIVTIIAGVVFLFKDPDHYYTSTVSSASFAGDFFTYEYKATSAVATNTVAAVRTIRELEDVVLKLGGLAFMVAGALIVIHFGKKCFSDEKA